MRRVMRFSRSNKLVNALETQYRLRDGKLVVMHGLCGRVADAAAAAWCQCRPCWELRVPAYWGVGKQAGHVRNDEMVRHFKSHKLLCLWDGESRGTESAIRACLTAGVEVVFLAEGPP